MHNFKIGELVSAQTTITEGGTDYKGIKGCLFPDKQYIHAVKGDEGTIEYIDDLGFPTVKFHRTGTSTIVTVNEIRRVP